MRPVFSAALLTAALLFSAGCLEHSEKVSLNPDGSGKSQIEMFISPPPNQGGMATNINDIAKSTAEGTIRSAKGVEAWSDVSYDVGADGQAHFKGTAYFKNISEYKIQQADDSPVTWAKDPAGGMTLSIISGKKAEPPAGAPPTDAEVAEKVKAARGQWNQQKAMMAPILDKLKMEVTYLLPGKVDQVTVFQSVPGGVKLAAEGKKMLTAMDKFMNDDAALTALIKSGKTTDDGPDDEMKNEMMFGQKGKISAHAGGELKPLFDYAAESEAARKGQAEMFKKLGIADAGPKSMPAPAPEPMVMPMPSPAPTK